MPLVRSHLEREAPSEPHLAVLLDESGMWTAIEKGATVLLIEDPSRADKIFPFILAKVSLKKIVFICGCGDPACNLNISYVANRKGSHTMKQRNAAYSKPEPSAPSVPSPKKDDP